MPYALEPLVAGELGEATLLDRSSHPPRVDAVEYVLDAPTSADLIEAFPVFLVSDELAERLRAAGLSGLSFERADVVPGAEYIAGYGDAPHKAYRRLRTDPAAPEPDAWVNNDLVLCVSDRMWETLRHADLLGCEVRSL